MRDLVLLRVVLLGAMLALAALWLLRVVADVSGPLLLLCPLTIQTYRWELRRGQR
jgi:hypothetical protein